jgi:glucose-6-phosphate isomerase
MSTLISASPAWKALTSHVGEIQSTHVRELLQDSSRNAALTAEFESLFLDFSRQRVTTQTMKLLLDLAEQAGLKSKIASMASGKAINTTENRAVMHVALRSSPTDSYVVDGVDVVPEVHAVLNKIEAFSNRVRRGELLGSTGQPLTDVVAIGIGGSYLGAEFVAEALHSDSVAHAAASGRRLSFLANVDPVAVARALEGFKPETTLVVIISKTFTTAETMLNARTVRRWLCAALGDSPAVIAKHVVAVSTAIDKCTSFGIDPNNIFAFWDWVGGRYSVSSAVGMLPLALQYGFETTQRFLAGARSIDQHFLTAPLQQNLPVLLGLLGVWNSSFLGYSCRALLSYSQAMHKFAPHIQQVDMESNGKRVAIDGTVLDFECGPINFGEPGTNGQHSFYQLIHQGRSVPCDFIGFVNSQHPIAGAQEVVSNHDELMSNFFAQPDALVCDLSILSALRVVVCVDC